MSTPQCMYVLPITHVCMYVCMYCFHEILFFVSLLERGTAGVGIAHIVFSQVL